MKRALSIILTLTLLLSTVTCMFPFQSATAEPVDLTAIVTQDFEEGNYPAVEPTVGIAGSTQIDADGNSGDAASSTTKTSTYGIVKDHDSNGNRYLKVDSTKWVRYITNNNTGTITDTTKSYNVTFKYRLWDVNGHGNTADGTKVTVKFFTHNGSTSNYNTENPGSTAANSPATGTAGVQLYYSVAKEATGEWSTATIYNLPYYTNNVQLQLLTDSSRAFALDLDDFVFSPANKVEVTSTGMGSVLTSAPYAALNDTLTFTAKEAVEGTFKGWVADDNTIFSTDKVLSFVYDGTQDLSFSAKFTDGIIQNFETGFTTTKVGEGATVQNASYTRNGKTGYGGYFPTETVGGVTNTFARFSNAAKWCRGITYTDTGTLKSKDTTTYNLTFKYRVSALVSGDATKPGYIYIQPGNDIITDGEGTLSTSGNSGDSNINGIAVYYDADDTTTWKTATIYNLNRKDTTGNLRLQFEATKRGTTALNEMIIDVDDFAFVEVSQTNARAEGAGSAYVNTSSATFDDTVTYTAVAPEGVTFYGWYEENATTPVSTDLVYSFNYDGTQKLFLTAKFSDGILQNFEEGFTVGATNFKRNPDTKTEETQWSTTVEQEANGNIYLNIKDFYNLSTLSESGKTIHYLTNDAETGLLDLNSNYKVTFKYRVRKGTSETFTEDTKGEKYPNGLKNGNVKIIFLPQDYNKTISSTETNKMISDPNRTVELSYDAATETEWKTATIFNLPRYKENGVFADEGMLKARITSASGYTVDLDDFYFAPVTISGDYDELSDWKIYDFITEQTDHGTAVRGNIIGDGYQEAASPSKYWASISYNLDSAYFYDSADEYSIRLKAQTQYTARKLNVEKNTDYVLSFKYYAPEKAVISGELKNNRANTARTLSSVGIVEVNGRYNYNSDDLISYVGYDNSFTGPYSSRITNYLTTNNSNVESWETFEIPFNSGDRTEVALVIQSGANTVYLENIKLEKRTMEIPGPGAPQEKKVIDFDSNGNVELEATDRMEIITAEGYDGTQSKMLHVFRGDYATPTLLNATTAYNADKDNLFTFAVKGNTVYKVSFRVKVAKDSTVVAKDLNGDGKKDSPWFAINAHYSGWQPQTKQMAYALWGRKDVWEEYTYYLQTDAKQDVFSFTFNAGQITPETWIDDITVEETDYAVFNGHGEAKEETVITFEDYAVNSEYSERLRLDAAPEKDGNKNNTAMKFIASRYDSAVCLNPTATRKATDPVLSGIPVKPNTLYTLSYWLYVSPDQDTNVTWFKFYYFQNAETWDVEGLLDATSMPERGKWVKFETTFLTANDQTKLNLALSAASKMPEMWLDDISVKEVMAGGVQIVDDASYASEFYNVLSVEGIADDITSGKSGVYKVPVSAMSQYTFGVTVNSSKTSASRVFLSFDGINPMSPSDVQKPVSMEIKADGTSARRGLMFVSDKSGFVYIVIENDDGALKLEAPTLFRSFSLSTAEPMGFAEPPLEALRQPETLQKLLLLGEDSLEDDLSADDLDSPYTGEKLVLPIALLLFALMLFTAVLTYKKSKKEENVNE